jgi:hypothetical protein
MSTPNRHDQLQTVLCRSYPHFRPAGSPGHSGCHAPLLVDLQHPDGRASGVVVIESRGLLHARLKASPAGAYRGLEFASRRQLSPLSAELIPANVIGRFLDDDDLRKLRQMLTKKRPSAPSVRRETATQAQSGQTTTRHKSLNARRSCSSARRERLFQEFLEWRRCQRDVPVVRSKYSRHQECPDRSCRPAQKAAQGIGAACHKFNG